MTPPLRERKSVDMSVVEIHKKDIVDDRNLYFNVITDQAGDVLVVIRDVSRGENTTMVFSAQVIHQMSRIIDGIMDSQSNVARKSHSIH